MMSGKPLDHSLIKNILVISLSNIGDVILTCPAIDILCRDFPSAQVTVVIGPKAATLLEGNARLRVVVYDKHMPWAGQWHWFNTMRRECFDLVVDLRNTLLPFFLNTRVRTRPQGQSFKGHMRQKHLDRLR